MDIETSAQLTPEQELAKRRQKTRERIAYLIVGTLCIVVLYAVIWGSIELKGTAIGTIGGIAGAAIGFYFKERAETQSGE